MSGMLSDSQNYKFRFLKAQDFKYYFVDPTNDPQNIKHKNL